MKTQIIVANVTIKNDDGSTKEIKSAEGPGTFYENLEEIIETLQEGGEAAEKILFDTNRQRKQDTRNALAAGITRPTSNLKTAGKILKEGGEQAELLKRLLAKVAAGTLTISDVGEDVVSGE